MSELPYISDISESLRTGGLNGLRVEAEAFSPGTIVASGVRGGPQSGVGSLLPSLVGSSLAWTLTSASAAPAALRAGGRTSPLAQGHAAPAGRGTANGFLPPARAEGHALRFMRVSEALGRAGAGRAIVLQQRGKPRTATLSFVCLLLWGARELGMTIGRPLKGPTP